MNRLRRFSLGVPIAMLALATASQASPILIYDTGVNNLFAPLANGASDTHYTLVAVPSGPPPATVQVRTSAGGFPIPPWLANDALSTWIGPAALNVSPGIYDFQTTFNLTGFNPGSAFLVGRWAMDNEGISIRLNGVSTGIQVLDPGASGNPYRSFSNFSITSGFVPGVNTVDFIVNNAGSTPNPTGLRVEVTGTATALPSAVPEPASLVLFGAGLAGLCMLRRRKLVALGKLQ